MNWYWSLIFPIFQWGVVLPVQGYLVYRTWRNWRQSERDRDEAYENLVKARSLVWQFRDWATLHGFELPFDDDDPGPTVQ